MKARKRWIGAWYANLSLSKKIYIPNFLIIFLLIVISGYIANNVVSNLMISRITSNTRQSLDIIMLSLDSALNDIETGALRVASDPIVQTILSKQEEVNHKEGLDQYFLVKTIFDKILFLRNFIDGISIYKLDGSLLGSGLIKYEKENEKRRLAPELISMAIESKGKNIWTDPSSLPYTYEHSAASGPTMFRAVLQGNLGAVIGVVEVKMNESIFSRLYSHLDYGKTGRFIVVNRQGMLVFPETNDYGLYNEFLRKRYFDWLTDYNSGGKVSTFGKERFVVISKHLERLGWVIIGMVPLNELLDYSRRMTISIYLIGIVCILLEIMFAFWISQAISKPIMNLSESMSDAAQGDLQIRVHADRNDEIGKLSQSFNEMVERISKLMDQVYLEQKRQRELELLALQSQINPHFLYNSLESICALSQLGRNDDSFKLGKSLSMFYRGVLSRGKPVVKIQEEINTLQYYINIQDIRYQNKFSYFLFCDNEIVQQKIIKLSLQPIVENSIYHGLKNVRRKGKIWIFGKRQGKDLIRFTIVDNGIGMEQSAAAACLEGSFGKNAGQGFGLSSVDQRIKLYFGDEYGLNIESRPGFWTKVHILLPFTPE